jgi:hypothetical protein
VTFRVLSANGATPLAIRFEGAASFIECLDLMRFLRAIGAKPGPWQTPCHLIAMMGRSGTIPEGLNHTNPINTTP